VTRVSLYIDKDSTLLIELNEIHIIINCYVLLEKDDRESLTRKKESYSGLPEKQRENVYKKAKQTYADEATCVEETKRNEQMVVTPIVADLGATKCYNVALTIGKGDHGNASGEKRKAYFEIGANKKERILSKAVRFFASNMMDSTIDHQMHGLGIIMNESCERSLAE